MKTIIHTIQILLALAIGAVGGNYYGKAQVLEQMVMGTSSAIVGLK